jgi:hypothetical protein
MPKARHFIYWMFITIIAYPFMSSTGQSSTQYLHVYGQAIEDAVNNNPVIDGIECARAEQFAFHIHTKFNITVNNESYPVPGGIGIIPNNCIYWLHTHDDSGIIHVESPVKKGFTLGQFLRIWNNFNSSDTVVQNMTNNNINGTIAVYVNGTQINNNTNYRDLELKDQDEISLMISHR